MKRIYLMRHAKADAFDPELPDFYRPLNDEGIQDAAMMGNILNALNIRPAVILSSPALRALTTAELVTQELNITSEAIIVEDSIYEAHLSVLLTLLESLDDTSNDVMIVGHNPGISELANFLCDKQITIPTCGVYGITCSTEHWNEIQYVVRKELLFDYPENYGR